MGYLLLGGGRAGRAGGGVGRPAGGTRSRRGPGLCGACHLLRPVVPQRLDRASRDETLDWMVEEQGVPALDPDECALILDYPETHFGRDMPR